MKYYTNYSFIVMERKYLIMTRKVRKEEKLSLTPPWETYRNMLIGIFERDPEVTVKELEKNDEDAENATYNITVEVSNHIKFVGMLELLNQSITMGNITLEIHVVDVSTDTSMIQQGIAAVFADNPLVNKIVDVEDQTLCNHRFVVFNPEVIQFHNDDLSDYKGNFTELAADVAKKLFTVDPLTQFCTVDVKEINE